MSWFSTATGVVSGIADTTQAAVNSAAGASETEAFLAGMQALTAESNRVQLAMGLMNLQKTLVEGFAKFLKDMGKGFTMQ